MEPSNPDPILTDAQKALTFYASYLSGNVIDIWTSPHYDVGLRLRMRKNALCVPLSDVAKKAIDKEFGADKLRGATHVMIHHTRFVPKGSTRPPYFAISACAVRTEEPHVSPVSKKDSQYVGTVYKDETYLFIFKSWPEKDTQRDRFFALLPTQ